MWKSCGHGNREQIQTYDVNPGERLSPCEPATSTKVPRTNTNVMINSLIPPDGTSEQARSSDQTKSL